MVLLLASLAVAAPASPIELVGSVGGAVGPPSAGGAVAGRVWWNPTPRWGVEVGGREGVVTGDARTLGVVLAGARWRADSGAFARFMFAHHHETPWDLAVAHPVQAALGTLEGIRHRTGLEVGAGWDVALLPSELSQPMGFVFALGVAAFPDPHGPPLYAHAEIGFRLGFKGREAAKEPS